MLRLPGKRQQPPAWLRAMEAPANDVEDEEESESEAEGDEGSSAEESGSEVVVGSYGSDAAGRSVLELLGQPKEGGDASDHVSHSCACIGSLCLRNCVHGASIGAGGGGGGPGRGPGGGPGDSSEWLARQGGWDLATRGGGGGSAAGAAHQLSLIRVFRTSGLSAHFGTHARTHARSSATPPP
jgi:hypothetical protein